MASSEVKMEEEDRERSESGGVLPNEIIYSQIGESNAPKDKEVIILSSDEIFRFTGRTGFLEEEKSVFQKAGHLRLQEAIPILPKRVAAVCLFLNFAFPGLGTAVGAFASLICPCEQYMAKRWLEIFILNIIAAVCQLATTVYFFIGYFWGIWWAIQMVQKSPSRSQMKIYNIKVMKEKKQSYLHKTSRPQKMMP